MTERELPAGLRIRSAEPGDADGVRRLLSDAGLGADDVDPVTGRFIVASDHSGLAGCVALDGQTPELLLRSLAVRASDRGAGIGRLLVDAALLDAWARRVRRVVLVTETAEAFFARQGFEPISRDDVADATAAHPQFNGACPESATVMVLEMIELG